jgi:hypothetical protein
MDGIENIVYVVIAIGWFVWNTYRKMQEGKQSSPKPASRPKTRPVQPTQDQPKTGPFQTLEDMILEQLEGEKDLEPVLVDSDTYENQDKFLSHDLTHSHLDDNYQMPTDESKSHRVERQIKPLEVEEVEEESLFDVAMPNGFNLRQAIVVNAVLERPYT